MFKLVKRIEGFETKLQALESPDSDKRAKSYTKTKIGSGIAIRKTADLIREKEKRRTPNFFSARKTRHDEPRAAGSSVAPAARTDRGGADGLGRLGAALFKGCPRAVSRSGMARSRFVFF